MTASIYVEVAIDPETCYLCGVTFGMARSFKKDRLTDGKTFYCPAGHGAVYGNSTQAELERVRGQLAYNRESLAGERADHQHTANRLAGTQGVLTRTKRRANAGVCLNCHRTFKDLVRHREKKHPELSA